MIAIEDSLQSHVARFTSICWTSAGDHQVVLATCTRDMSAADIAGLISTVIRIDDAQYVVRDLAAAGRTLLLRVSKPN